LTSLVPARHGPAAFTEAQGLFRIRKNPSMTAGFTVIRDTTPDDAIPRGAVVAMGNFDGVHLGHRAVISAALNMGRAHGKPAFAVTFEPHPRKISFTMT
jgi:hypothetical protein